MVFLGKAIDGLMNTFMPVLIFLFYGIALISILVLFLAIFLLPPAFIMRLPQWISSHNDSHIKIKYSTFISMYNIKPCAWELEDDTVFYKTKTNDNGWYHETKTHFYFDSYIDYCYYRRFLNKVLKEKDLKELKFMKEKNYKELERVLDRWKNDIEEHKKNNDAEIKKKIDELGVLD